MNQFAFAKTENLTPKFGNLAQNLGLLIEAQNIKQTELASKTGVLTSTINKILKGTVDNPQLFTLMTLCDFFNVTIGQLVGREALPNWVFEKNGFKTPSSIEAPSVKFIPILSFDEIINWLSHHEYSELTKTISVDNSYSDDAFAIRLASTLNNRFQKRSLLIFTTDEIIASENYVLISENNQSPQVRTVVCDGDRIYLKPLEDFIPPVELNDNIKVIARLVEIRYWSR